MSFDGIKVNHGGMEQGASDVMAAAKAIEARLDQLEGELKPLASDWEGAAKTAYHTAKTQWDQAINSMVQLLQQASTGVTQSNAEYKGADTRGQARFE